MILDLIDRHRLSVVSPRQTYTDKLLGKLRTYLEEPLPNGMNDEKVWMLLFIYGFVADSRDDQVVLARRLTDSQCCMGPTTAWLEMLPMPARQGRSGLSESNTEVDLVAGDCDRRGQTISGIQYKPSSGREGWVCFVEAKWLCDLDCQTEHDFQRNQMSRVIETALTFQGPSTTGSSWPDNVHFTLLTPEKLRPANPYGGGTRLYHYKFHEYRQHPDALLHDIRSAIIPQRPNEDGWSYPDLTERIGRLSMHWVTFEEILEVMPDTAYKRALIEFINGKPSHLLERVATDDHPTVQHTTEVL